MTPERLEGLITTAERPVVITPPAAVGATVEVMDIATGRVMSYALVEPADARPGEGMLSIESPVGAALRGRCAGDEVVAGTPRGERRLRVLRVS